MIKKFLWIASCIFILYLSAADTQAAFAKPSSARLIINGYEVKPISYNINGSNYFKLRDIAYILSGTENSFDVGYDSYSKQITISTNSAYEQIGGEMEPSAYASVNVNPSNVLLSVNGYNVRLVSYNIGGHNYFMLRDLAKIAGFDIDWDSTSKSVVIASDPNNGFTPQCSGSSHICSFYKN